MPTTKELWQKKPLPEIEALIYDCKQKIAAEKNLVTLGKLNSELKDLQEIREQKMKASGGLIRKTAQSQGKTPLKSFDDYVKSKK